MKDIYVITSRLITLKERYDIDLNYSKTEVPRNSFYRYNASYHHVKLNVTDELFYPLADEQKFYCGFNDESRGNSIGRVIGLQVSNLNTYNNELVLPENLERYGQIEFVIEFDGRPNSIKLEMHRIFRVANAQHTRYEYIQTKREKITEIHDRFYQLAVVGDIGFLVTSKDKIDLVKLVKINNVRHNFEVLKAGDREQMYNRKSQNVASAFVKLNLNEDQLSEFIDNFEKNYAFSLLGK